MAAFPVTYICKSDVFVKRDGELLPDPAFKAGRTYECAGMSGRDHVLTNESGGQHLISRAFLKKHFGTNGSG